MTLSELSEGKEFLLILNDGATILDALASADKYIYEHPRESIFPIFNGYIHNYLQLFWNLEENKIYDDVGLMPYGPDEKGDLRKFMPLRYEPNFNLYPDSVIELQLDPGCWWEKVQNRIDIGKFKTLIRSKFDKNNEIFSHYFKIKN